MSVVFALVSSLLFGSADFGGGMLTRRLPAMTVLVVSQTVAAVVLGVVVAATGGWAEAGPRLWFAVAAGVVGSVALLSFYRALALGPMGVVSPLATLGVAVPVVLGLLLGERPALSQYGGIAVALAGIALAGGPRRGGPPVQPRTIALALVAAGGFGTVMVLVAKASVDDGGLCLALWVQRVFSVAGGGVQLALATRRGRRALPDGGVAEVWRRMPFLAFVGITDVAANGAFALAARHGSLAVAAVLASLYPVVTALAARIVLGERLLPVQAAGAGMALVGSVLLAAG